MFCAWLIAARAVCMKAAGSAEEGRRRCRRLHPRMSAAMCIHNKTRSLHSSDSQPLFVLPTMYSRLPHAQSLVGRPETSSTTRQVRVMASFTMTYYDPCTDVADFSSDTTMPPAALLLSDKHSFVCSHPNGLQSSGPRAITCSSAVVAG